MGKKFTIICPANYLNKVAAIKALRNLTGMGLKETNDACKIVGTTQTFEVQASVYQNYLNPETFIEEQYRMLRVEGVQVGGLVHQILEDLRKLAIEALKQGEDELANEILQLVLVEKLRREDS